MGSGEPWKLVDYIKSFNYLNYDGGQFSTSQGRGVFMDQALEILPADYWRWYLTANAPEGSDAAFTWEGFQAAVNSDLANVLGNFVNRITKYTAYPVNITGEKKNVGGMILYLPPADRMLPASMPWFSARYLVLRSIAAAKTTPAAAPARSAR